MYRIVLLVFILMYCLVQCGEANTGDNHDYVQVLHNKNIRNILRTKKEDDNEESNRNDDGKDDEENDDEGDNDDNDDDEDDGEEDEKSDNDDDDDDDEEDEKSDNDDDDDDEEDDDDEDDDDDDAYDDDDEEDEDDNGDDDAVKDRSDQRRQGTNLSILGKMPHRFIHHFHTLINPNNNHHHPNDSQTFSSHLPSFPLIMMGVAVVLLFAMAWILYKETRGTRASWSPAGSREHVGLQESPHNQQQQHHQRQQQTLEMVPLTNSCQMEMQKMALANKI